MLISQTSKILSQFSLPGAIVGALLLLLPGQAAATLFTFDTGVEGWTTSVTTGVGPWGHTSLGCAGASAGCFFTDDPSSISDVLLISPVLTSAGAVTLDFDHLYNVEGVFDGGVVEININGIGWADVGNGWSSNGYTSVISTSFGNPLGGQSAFSGDSTTFINSVIALAPTDGQDFQIRFRFASDNSVSRIGWWVDNVNFTNLAGDNGPGPAPVPVPATLALFGLGLATLGWSRRKKA